MTEERNNIFYRLLRVYVVTLHRLYYPKFHVIGAENVPAEGNPVVMVACHQNCLIDGISPHLALTDRKTHGLARSGAFNSRFSSWFLRKLGLLPISRMGFEGEEEMKRNNADTLDSSIKTLLQGHTLILFPEAGHQDKRWLGYFSLMYVRLAFDAAKAAGYEREVYIAPFAHHYGHYHHPFYPMMLMFGEAIPISPYYERYQTKPRTCQREISAIIEKRISEMMLDIRDLDNYHAIDYIRESGFGVDYCRGEGLNPAHLPDKLAADKRLVERLAALHQAERDDIYAEAGTLDADIKRNGLRDWLFDVRRPGWLLALYLAASVALAPLALASFILTFPVYIPPAILKRRPINGAVDRMFDSTYDLGATGILTYPLLAVLLTIPAVLLFSWRGLLWPVVCLAMIVLVCRYRRLWAKTLGLWRLVISKRQVANSLRSRRKSLFDSLKTMLNLRK